MSKTFDLLKESIEETINDLEKNNGKNLKVVIIKKSRKSKEKNIGNKKP